MHDVEGLLAEEEELAARDIKRMAAREPKVPEPCPDSLIETVDAIVDAAADEPFGKQEHDLLLKSIEHIANDWLAQLEHVRRNSYAVEALVLERAAKLRSDITGLFALGNAVMQEAQRGEQVNAGLTRELEKMSEERA
jgi:hypothetical protein